MPNPRVHLEHNAISMADLLRIALYIVPVVADQIIMAAAVEVEVDLVAVSTTTGIPQ